jgi:hypothetical protein
MGFKAGVYNKDTKNIDQKDYQIDPKFQAIMKDAESEKLVRDLHAKAYGLDSVKERYTEARGQIAQVSQENTEIKAGIQEARKIYQSAVQTGNWHKLDQFFEKLQIPQENILKYAYAKVQLSEMPPEQKQAVLNQLDAERRADIAAQQQQKTASAGLSQAQQMRQLQIEVAMSRPDVAEMAKAFDERLQKPGAFMDAMRREGSLAWHQGQDILPNEAIKRVIENYGLKVGAPAPAATPAAGLEQAPPAKPPLVQRTDKIIPNVQGRGTSPVRTPKPRSVDDLIKYRKEVHGH